MQIETGLFIADPVLCYAQIAEASPLPRTVAIGFELCGSYRLSPDNPKGFTDASALLSHAELGKGLESLDGIRGVNPALRALPFILEGAASPKETALALMLCLPYRYGGYGLPLPQMNPQIDVGARARSATNKDSYRCDLLWPRYDLAVEYDSDSYHTGSHEIASDASRRNSLAHLGFSVVTVTRRQINNLLEVDRIAKQLAQRMGHRIRIKDPDWRRKQTELVASLNEYSHSAERTPAAPIARAQRHSHSHDAHRQ